MYSIRKLLNTERFTDSDGFKKLNYFSRCIDDSRVYRLFQFPLLLIAFSMKAVSRRVSSIASNRETSINLKWGALSQTLLQKCVPHMHQIAKIRNAVPVFT